MRMSQNELTIHTQPKSLTNFTSELQKVIDASKLRNGICTLFVRHTSASIVIQENADPDVLLDLQDAFSRLAPEGAHYRHDAEGPDDMPAHIRTALTHTSEQIPFQNGKLVLGTWQAVYLWEHRSSAHARRVFVHLVGEA